MIVKFCLNDGGEELFEIDSHDVAGLIEAAKGDKVSYKGELYSYNNHALYHYDNDGKVEVEVLVYLDEYLNKKPKKLGLGASITR
ncbi:hypothetical protein [Fictibacillus phosphorivorans]|uniref:hypothetical protein n=1 Tax=Fictibacillus phosphorivorans TaxID=1221500 RepID=UPI0035EF8845